MNDVPESPEVWVATSLLGPLLDDAGIARLFAELILRRLHGDAELDKQRPLRVTDQGTDWVVVGSYQEPSQIPGTGAWMVRVRKSDCCVRKFGHWQPTKIPDEIKSFFSQDTQPL